MREVTPGGAPAPDDRPSVTEGLAPLAGGVAPTADPASSLPGSETTASPGARSAGPPAHELRGALAPGELAEAAVLGDLALVFVVLGWFLPLGSAFLGLAIVPFAALSARQRARAPVVAIIAVSAVAFLVGGLGIVLQAALVGSLGLAVGLTYRRRWRPATSVLVAAVSTALPIAAVTLAAEAISPGLRKLAFAQIEIVWRAVEKVLRRFGLDRLATAGNHLLAWCIEHWWLVVPLFEFVLIVFAAAVCARYLWPLLQRLERDTPPPTAPARRPSATGGPDEPEPAPLPIELERVSYQYPGSFGWAVAEVSLRLEPGEFVALVGPNGSGKSTLVRMISGRLEPTLGRVRRAGSPGLGRPGGTAVVFQRPESQVLGVRARDDIAWGLPVGEHVDVAALLGRVGLEGFEDRETSGLSGGELQRLAIASALARHPRLLISDESTAMIDGPGRAEVVDLLERLASEGIAVVHVTHRPAEAARADDLISMLGGRRAPKPLEPRAPGPGATVVPPGGAGEVGTAASRSDGAPEPPIVVLRDVSYTYAADTPWARVALQGIDLEIRSGEGIVVAGSNGSGKSTLAWVLAGLTAPTTGEALLDGRPVTAGDAGVGIAFQHARLQLIRATVLADVAYGADEDAATAAMKAVGLDPVTMGPRRVDELSGGEQRRVAIAGLLVRDPRLLVLDEPYAGLDDEARQSLAALLRELRSTRRISTVVVSHDLDNAELLGDRLLRLDAGRIVSSEPLGGTP